MAENAIKSKHDADWSIAMVQKLEAELLKLKDTLDGKEVKLQNLTEKHEDTEKTLENQERDIDSLKAEIELYQKEACLQYPSNLKYHSLTKIGQ
jgi:chromosome segregation ATPase